jgi:hypothetical protein
MGLNAFFSRLAALYNVGDDFKSPGQLLLKNAPSELANTAPPTINIDFGGGKGNRTPTPWVAYMNPDETNSARRGIYVVYLLSADKENLVLILGQGVSELSEKYGARDARSRLTGEVKILRERLPEEKVAMFNDPVDLRSNGSLQRSYVAGTVCCRLYKTAELPADEEMQKDLDAFLDLYETAIEIKQRLLQVEPGVIETSSWTKTNEVANLLIGFKPKSSDDYRSVLVGKVLVKSRSHERLVKNFGEACQAKGYEPFTPHPVDLVLRLLSEIILVEAKVVYKGNATSAVRGVVGQLLDYRYHLYPPPQDVKLLGLFSESIGNDFVEFLASLSIGVVWWSHEGWQCSQLAKEWGLSSLK